MTALEAHTRATYGRALVPESWCQDDTPDAIQVFYKELFYKGKETQATDTSVICLEVEIRMHKNTLLKSPGGDQSAGGAPSLPDNLPRFNQSISQASALR